MDRRKAQQEHDPDSSNEGEELGNLDSIEEEDSEPKVTFGRLLCKHPIYVMAALAGTQV